MCRRRRVVSTSLQAPRCTVSGPTTDVISTQLNQFVEREGVGNLGLRQAGALPHASSPAIKHFCEQVLANLRLCGSLLMIGCRDAGGDDGSCVPAVPRYIEQAEQPRR